MPKQFIEEREQSLAESERKHMSGHNQIDETAAARLRVHAMSIFRLGRKSIHGPDHWRRVEATFKLIATETGADVTVGLLFAIYHDSCRLDENLDLDHGRRAADFLVQISITHFTLDAPRLELLVFAVRHHTDGQTSEDATVGACWDADRLDLGRVGIVPTPALLSTAAGKEIAVTGSKFIFKK